jgi:hypothetical protein
MKWEALCWLVFAWTSAAFAQPQVEWTTSFGDGHRDERCRAFVQTSDGGYVLGGQSGFPGSTTGCWIIKTDGAGDSTWSRRFQRDTTDYCTSLIRTFDGGYALGCTSSHDRILSNGVFWLIKTDANGDSVWSRTYRAHNLNFCTQVLQTLDSGYVLVGSTGTYDAGNRNFWLVKTNANGDSLWSREYGGSDWDGCAAVQQTADSGYILAGTTYSFGAGRNDFWLVKTDSRGDSMWSCTYGGPDWDVCSAVVQCADGGYAVAGSQSPYGGTNNFYLVRTGSDGVVLWTRTFGGENADVCTSLELCADGGFLLGGSTSSFGAGLSDCWLLKVSILGDSLWSAVVGTGGAEECNAIHQTGDGGFLLAGSRDATAPDFYAIKLSAEPSAASVFNPAPSLTLLSNYPNPFNPSTTIEFTLLRITPLTIRVFDELGRESATLAQGDFTAGMHSVVWDGRNYASGTYWISLDGPAVHLTRKMILMK